MCRLHLHVGALRSIITTAQKCAYCSANRPSPPRGARCISFAARMIFHRELVFRCDSSLLTSRDGRRKRNSASHAMEKRERISAAIVTGWIHREISLARLGKWTLTTFQSPEESIIPLIDNTDRFVRERASVTSFTIIERYLAKGAS